jgi:hypothetical protein
MYLLFLSNFNENLNFLDGFFKNSQILSFIKIRPVGAEFFHAGRRTDAHDMFLRTRLKDHTELKTYQDCQNFSRHDQSGMREDFVGNCLFMYDFYVRLCTIIPLITGATEIITESLKKNLRAIPGKHSTDSLHKTAVLATSHIIRKALQSETI